VKGPIFSFTEEKTSNRQLSYFDFVLSGILGLALMNASIIGISVSMAHYREDQILKRITTTPLKTWWFIVDEVLSRLVLNVFQVSLILLVGVVFFGAHIYGNYFVLYALALLGAVLFQLIGFVVASLTKSTDAAQGMATAITIPMMFLGGVFFPIDSLPKWLFSIVQYLPIAPLLRLIRQTALEGASPLSNLNYLGIILAWIIATLVFASYKFRLTEE
jgi:ABC-2 type transport system permease protein